MPSAYLLAKDQIEQARAILANEVWFDPELDNLFELALFRLGELEGSLHDTGLELTKPTPLEPRRTRSRMMPWLAP